MGAVNEIQSVTAGDGAGDLRGNLAAEQPLRLDRRFLLFSLLAALLFSWPLLVFGSPSYIQDSAAYYKGGRAAVSYAVAELDRSEVTGTGAEPRRASPSPSPSSEKGGSEIRGVRSITYSVATYLLAAPGATLVLLTIVQALAAGIVTVATLGAFGGLPARRTVTALLVLAGASTIAPVSFLTVPDIFAGLLIGSMVLLTVVPSHLSLGVRVLCIGIATFAVTAHASHIPLAGGMTILGIGWVAVRLNRKRPLMPWTWAGIVAPLVIGGLSVVALNRVAFGEISLTAKRYPFTLARSVDDGPGRWYLEKHCGEVRYTICAVYPGGLPKGGALEFLWGENGVANRATPAQLDRIRAEEAEIVLAAAREYPGFEVRTHAFNLARQILNFTPYPFESRLALDQSGTPQLAPAPQDGRILLIVRILTSISVAIGTVWLVRVFFKRRALRPVIALMFLGVLGNALTCVLLSAVAARYQARVVWLIPLLALTFASTTAARSCRSDGGDA
jgi:hypothetical protein